MKSNAKNLALCTVLVGLSGCTALDLIDCNSEFSAADANGDGLVSPAEFTDALSAEGVDELVEIDFGTADTDQDGFLSDTEGSTACAAEIENQKNKD